MDDQSPRAAVLAGDALVQNPGATPHKDHLRRVPPLIGDPLLTAREAASYRRQGLSTFWRDVRSGLVPQPIRVTPRAPRWFQSWLVPGGHE
jgi:predicted DNA-binding transcriptional regulator AlpA